MIRKLASGGEYSHIGLEKGIRQVLQGCLLPDIDCLEIQFNTDGLPFLKVVEQVYGPYLVCLKIMLLKQCFLSGFSVAKKNLQVL